MKKFTVKSAGFMTVSTMILYLVQFGTQYIGYNYLPVYIDALPFSSNSTVGLVVAVGAATTVLAQPVWGRLGDHAKSKNTVLIIAMILQALTGFLFFAEVPNLWLLLAFTVLFYIPFLAPQVLIDTIVVENLDRLKVRFGTLRCFGSGGAALMAFIFGAVSGMTSVKAFTLFAVFAAASILPLLPLPQTKGHARASSKNASPLDLFKNKRYVLFLFYGFALFLCGTMILTFMPIYFATEKGLNAGMEVYGIFFGFTILLEAVLMLLGSRLFAKMNPYVVFMIPLAAGIFRMLIPALAHTWQDMLLYPLFHALWFAPMWAKVPPFIQAVVPPEMRATGQSVWTIVTCGIAPVIGSLAAGWISDWIGIRAMLLVVMGMIAVFTAFFAVLFLLRARADRREGWKMEEG